MDAFGLGGNGKLCTGAASTNVYVITLCHPHLDFFQNLCEMCDFVQSSLKWIDIASILHTFVLIHPVVDSADTARRSSLSSRRQDPTSDVQGPMARRRCRQRTLLSWLQCISHFDCALPRPCTIHLYGKRKAGGATPRSLFSKPVWSSESPPSCNTTSPRAMHS
jgi:hypothetical protein